MLLKGPGWLLPDPGGRQTLYPDSAYRVIVHQLEHSATDREALQAFRDHLSTDPTLQALRHNQYVQKIRPKRQPPSLF